MHHSHLPQFTSSKQAGPRLCTFLLQSGEFLDICLDKCSLSEDSIGHTTKTCIKLPWNATRGQRMEYSFKRRMTIPRYANGIIAGNIRSLRVKKKKPERIYLSEPFEQYGLQIINFTTLGHVHQWRTARWKWSSPLYHQTDLAASSTNWSWRQTMSKAHRHSWACFLSLARSKLRLCSANHRAGYFSNLACDWLSIVWAYSEQETENGPCYG